MLKNSQNLYLNDKEKEQKSEIQEGLLWKCKLNKRDIRNEDVEKGNNMCKK